MKQKKVDNRPAALDAKLDLRRRVLSAMPGARVFEAYCGDTAAKMWPAWAGAAKHVGCDVRYTWPDPRQRWVGDALRVMRAIDLSEFDVFDVDPYGEPWSAMVILAARRQWARGERGAVVLTDGAGRRTKFGLLPAGMGNLLGARRCAPKDRHDRLHMDCLSAWAERANVELQNVWTARSVKGQPMIYSAALFAGRGGKD